MVNLFIGIMVVIAITIAGVIIIARRAFSELDEYDIGHIYDTDLDPR